MKCIIPGSNVKVFGRAVHCLSKVGEDLYMEPLDTGLALRAVNSSRSAYSCFLFRPNFFLRYDDGSGSATQSSQVNGETTRWRITMKSCLAVFKSLSSLEKNVDRCTISLDPKECRLVFQLHCRHGIVKTYNLVYQETETLQAVFSKDLCPNRITAPSKLLAEAVASFQASQEEITLIVSPTQLGIKNYVDDEPDPSRVVHSEMHLVPEEFTDYSIGVDTQVTFCLKELRAILSFSDSAGLPVSIHFETMGKPIVFTLESEQTVEATFVLATLAKVSSSQMTSASQQTSRLTQSTQASQQTSRLTQSTQATANQRHTNKGRANYSARKAPAPKKTQLRGDGDARRLPNGHTGRNEEVEDDEFPDDLMLDLLNRHERTANETTSREDMPSSSRLHLVPSTSVSIDDADVSASPIIPFDSALNHRFQKTLVNQSYHDNKDIPLKQQYEEEEEEGHTCTSPNRTLLANFVDENSEGSTGEVEGSQLLQDEGNDVAGDDGKDDDDGYDFIPGTPPSKKFKSMFFGASQSQQSQSSMQRRSPPPSQPHPRGGSVTVLAEDSDED